MADKLLKAVITENITDKTGIFRHEVEEVVNAFFEELKTGLKDGKIVELRGFGSFEVRIRKGRANARNPKTGEVVSSKEHGVVVFRPGRELKEKVWDI